MSTATPTTAPHDQSVLEDLIRGCRLDHAIDGFVPRDQALPHYLQQLSLVGREIVRRGLARPDDLDDRGSPWPTVTTLESLWDNAPIECAAFLQALVTVRSPELLLASWRLLQGLVVQSCRLDYVCGQTFQLKIELGAPGEDAATEAYTSTDIFDLPFVRHLSYKKLNNAPVIDGFLPLRLE